MFLDLEREDEISFVNINMVTSFRLMNFSKKRYAWRFYFDSSDKHDYIESKCFDSPKMAITWLGRMISSNVIKFRQKYDWEK